MSHDRLDHVVGDHQPPAVGPVEAAPPAAPAATRRSSGFPPPLLELAGGRRSGTARPPPGLGQQRSALGAGRPAPGGSGSRTTGVPRRGSRPGGSPAGRPGVWTPSTAPARAGGSGPPPGPRPGQSLHDRQPRRVGQRPEERHRRGHIRRTTIDRHMAMLQRCVRDEPARHGLRPNRALKDQREGHQRRRRPHGAPEDGETRHRTRREYMPCVRPGPGQGSTRAASGHAGHEEITTSRWHAGTDTHFVPRRALLLTAHSRRSWRSPPGAEAQPPPPRIAS